MVLGRTYQTTYQANGHIAEAVSHAVVAHNVVRMPVTSESGSMSDNSETSSSGDDKSTEIKNDDICRDYLRNVCKRGKRCKYRHPDPNEAKVLGRRHDYTFCHDYQNSGCRRHNCRFLHCTRDEEDYYKQTGQLPARLQQAAALGIGVTSNELPLLRGEVPVCKDFLKGQCMRGGRCKYRHVSTPQQEIETPAKEGTPRNGTTENLESPSNFISDDYDRYTSEYDSTTTPTVVAIATKRRRTEESFTSFFPRATATPVDYTWLLEEENNILRRKVDELKKQVSDLAATNEVLLEQNARYRSSKANAINHVVPPIITVSQVVTPTITPAPAIHRDHRPIMAHHVQNIAALTGPAQLTVNANSELIMSQPSMPQLNNTPVTVTLNSVTQSIVPVSIMDTTIAPPGSLSTVSMTQNIGQPQNIAHPVPPVSLSQPVLPSAQHAQTLCIGSNLSTPLVSYPIMSHCVTLPNTSLG